MKSREKRLYSPACELIMPEERQMSYGSLKAFYIKVTQKRLSKMKEDLS